MNDVLAEARQLDIDYARHVEDANAVCQRSLVERVAAHFKAHPDVWIDGRELSKIGGYAGYRTRISDCRCDLGMAIENRTRRESGYTISEYRYVPGAAQPGREVAA